MEKYNLSILYVEDNEENRELFSEILEQRVKKLFVVDNGADAIETYKNNHIDLIITDVRMPKMDGITMSKKIREINSEAKIILLTGCSDSKNLLEAINLGIDTYIIKPLEYSRLNNELSKFNKILNFEKEQAKKDQLLNEYKKAVDLSCIVSETDIDANIIYVNKEFENITGYESCELIGQTHDIIKHPDTSALFIKEIWDTLKATKTPWNGILKHKRKDGTEFYTNTFINPILNENNQITKFILLRTDVTEIEKSKQQLSDQFYMANENYENANNLVSLYENAINESNVIIKIDENYQIKDVNNTFCLLTKYTKKELINKSFFFLKDSLESVETSQSMNKFLHSNNKGIWKGELNIVDKVGNELSLIATITSIKDKNGNFIEYIVFIQDITEIINLHKELEEAQREIIYKMGEIAESKSKETGLHVKRVAEYSKLLAIKYGLNFKESELLKFASPMHDIGKIAISDSILNKPDKLTFEEYEVMKEHANIGYQLLNNSSIEILKIASIISHEHHEKWDGTGYPQGLRGNNIHIYGRITAIADVFDALSTPRVYKKAWEINEVLEFLRNEKGKHFDPHLVDLFFDNINEFLDIKEKFKEAS